MDQQSALYQKEQKNKGFATQLKRINANESLPPQLVGNPQYFERTKC